LSIAPAKTSVKLPARAVRGGNPFPPPSRIARAGLYLLVVAAAVAGLAFSFEVGRFRGHREGIAYAERKTRMVDYALATLGEAADATRACHDLAQYLKVTPSLPRRGAVRQLNLAKRALEEPCKNCGGE
jgi:hypothetical protein